MIELMDTADCPPGTSAEVVVQGRIVAVFNVNGVFHALDGVCPHQGGPLGKSELTGEIATCPWHAWKFNVRTGRCLISAAIQQPTIPIVESEGKLWLDSSAEQ